jgi:hypothetical protein
VKHPPSLPKRVSRFVVATLLIALAGTVWLLVIKDPIKDITSDPIAREYGIENYYVGKDGFRHDNVGLTPEFKKAAKELEPEITEATDKSGLSLGKVHFADRLLKELLQKRYSIQWRTLQEMNPEVMID